MRCHITLEQILQKQKKRLDSEKTFIFAIQFVRKRKEKWVD